MEVGMASIVALILAETVASMLGAGVDPVHAVRDTSTTRDSHSCQRFPHRSIQKPPRGGQGSCDRHPANTATTRGRPRQRMLNGEWVEYPRLRAH